jgi:hypothetical protein
MRALAAAAALCLLLQACSPTTPPHRTTPPTTTEPTGTSPAPSSTSPSTSPPPAETTQAAARRLAGEAFRRATGEAAVRAILTRSGIPIISASDGSLVNIPARPTYVDFPVYDFEVPMLAAALRTRQTWFLEDLQDLPDWLMSPVLGRDRFGPDDLVRGLPRWAGKAFSSQDRPGAFAGLVMRQLGLHHPGEPDIFGQIDADAFPIDPLQFLLAGASMLSRTGEVAAGGTSDCDRLKITVDDERDPMSLAAQMEDQTRAYDRLIRHDGLRQVQADLFADLVLLSTLQLADGDDTGSAITAPQRGGPQRNVQLRAELSWDSPIPSTTIGCGPLAGLTMPRNGPLPGWVVVWVLHQDTERVRPSSDTEAGKVGNVEGGATERAGEITDAGGRSTLKLQVLPRPADVHGPMPPSTVTVLGEIDVFRTGGRFGLFDLVPTFRAFHGHTREIAKFWARQAIIEIGLPVALDRLAITYPLAP